MPWQDLQRSGGRQGGSTLQQHEVGARGVGGGAQHFCCRRVGPPSRSPTKRQVMPLYRTEHRAPPKRTQLLVRCEVTRVGAARHRCARSTSRGRLLTLEPLLLLALLALGLRRQVHLPALHRRQLGGLRHLRRSAGPHAPGRLGPRHEEVSRERVRLEGTTLDRPRSARVSRRAWSNAGNPVGLIVRAGRCPTEGCAAQSGHGEWVAAHVHMLLPLWESFRSGSFRLVQGAAP